MPPAPTPAPPPASAQPRNRRAPVICRRRRRATSTATGSCADAGCTASRDEEAHRSRTVRVRILARLGCHELVAACWGAARAARRAWVRWIQKAQTELWADGDLGSPFDGYTDVTESVIRPRSSPPCRNEATSRFVVEESGEHPTPDFNADRTISGDTGGIEVAR